MLENLYEHLYKLNPCKWAENFKPEVQLMQNPLTDETSQALI